MTRQATDEELARWDSLVAANPDDGNPLQCRAFGETKARFGWRPRFLIHELPDAQIAALYLCRSVRGLGELWYCPKGPGVTNTKQLERIISSLRTETGQAFLVKLEADLLKTDDNLQHLSQIGLTKSQDLQFNYATVNVDLRPDEEALLQAFKQKTRYNIRLAQRKEVNIQVVEPNEANLQQMYQLMTAVGGRTGVHVRKFDYFRTFWKLHAQQGSGQLFFASYRGKVLAGAFVTYLGTKALYKDGGSVREHSDVQAPYLLQWEIVRWLKARGVTEYDLHGVPAPAENQPDHPRFGLWRFKSGFSDQVIEYTGTWDLPLKPKAYKTWRRLGERLATRWALHIRRELFY